MSSIPNFKLISFTTKDGLELFGGLVDARNDELSNKSRLAGRGAVAIIHVHGMTDHFFEGNTMSVVKKVAEELGYGFLSFNNRGAELITLINGSFYGTCMEKFEESTYDIEAAITFMKKQGYGKIILSGHSTGCQKTAYYQYKKKNKNVKAIVFLSPADDIGFQKKILGKKFTDSIQHAHKMIEEGLADYPVPESFMTPYFSARRYYNLYSGKTMEAHIFNYAEPLKVIKNLKNPFLAVFAEGEQYAAIPPKEMLKKIAKYAQNRKSKTALIPDGDHSFHGQGKRLAQELRKFLTSL